MMMPTPDAEILSTQMNQCGRSLAALSTDTPLLLVFLRHFGCTFCREAMSDISLRRDLIEGAGLQIGLVHMGPEDKAQAILARYGLDDVSRFADPDKTLYRAFHLSRGTACRLFGPKVWVRGVRAGILAGHGLGPLVGDGFQMPGVFVLYRGRVTAGFRHQSAADRPDYAAIAREGAPPELPERPQDQVARKADVQYKRA